MSPWAQHSDKVPLVLSLWKQRLHSGQRGSIFAFSISVLAHSNPLTFLASHKCTFGSSSLSIYCPTHQLLLQIIKVIWILSLPFVILDVLESVAPILMIKFHTPIFFIIIENVKLQIFRNNTWNLIIYFQQQKRLLVNILNLYNFPANYVFHFSFNMCVKRERNLTKQNHTEISTKFYSMHSIFSRSPMLSLSHRKWGKLEGTFMKIKSVKTIVVSSQCQQRQYLLCFRFPCVA